MNVLEINPVLTREKKHDITLKKKPKSFSKKKFELAFLIFLGGILAEKRLN
jgi:hypothetical protein